MVASELMREDAQVEVPEGARTVSVGPTSKSLEALTCQASQSQSPTPGSKGRCHRPRSILTSWESRIKANNRRELLLTINRARL